MAARRGGRHRRRAESFPAENRRLGGKSDTLGRSSCEEVDWWSWLRREKAHYKKETVLFYVGSGLDR